METIKSVLDKCTELFRVQGVSEPRPSAEHLLANVMHCRRLDLYLRFDHPMSAEELEAMRSHTRRRLRHEPVQYIVGDTEFFGRVFHVRHGVLIPRPDTEHLVEHVLRLSTDISSTSHHPLHILDVGTGSGCIAVTLCAEIPELTCDAVDIDPKALELARENARRHTVAERIHFIPLDILREPPPAVYDVIVSNPPYLTDSELQETGPEVRDFEPGCALSDGADGLVFHRRLAACACEHLRPRGALAVEMGFGQRLAVEQILTDARLRAIEVHADYAGIDRVIIARSAV